MMVGLARALRETGCESVVGVIEDQRFPASETAGEAERQGLEVVRIACSGRFDWRAIRRLRNYIESRRVDIVHSHGYKSDCYAFAAAWPRRAALFATSHNWPDGLRSMQAYAMFDRQLLRRFDGVAVVSERVADMLLRAGVAPERIALVPNGIDIASFAGVQPALREEFGWGGDYVIGFAGRLVREKGGELLIRAAAPVLAAFPEARLVFVGEGPERARWEAAAASAGVGGRVHFLGRRHDMPQVYASFNVLVLPSFIEAMPMCVIEAMAAGCPVIATNVGATSKAVIHERTGQLIEAGDVAGLSLALRRSITDPPFAGRLARGAAVHVADRFSDMTMARSYLALYRQAVPGRRQSLATV
jgi:glycosyltransferase involved in cell wall biosynthesis